MMVRLRISQSVSLSHDILRNPLLQMRVTLSLSVVASSAPNDAVRVSSPPPKRETRVIHATWARGSWNYIQPFPSISSMKPTKI